MDKPSQLSTMYRAPGAMDGSHALHFPGAMPRPPFPPIDNRLVVLESGTEMIDGELVRAQRSWPEEVKR